MNPLSDPLSFRGELITTAETRIKQPFDWPDVAISAGRVGKISTGLVGSSLFDYSRECPIMFNDNQPHANTPVAIPWENLEIYDDPSS